MENIKGKPVTNLTKGCFQHLLKLFSHHLQDKSSARFASLFITSYLLDGKSLLFSPAASPASCPPPGTWLPGTLPSSPPPALPSLPTLKCYFPLFHCSSMRQHFHVTELLNEYFHSHSPDSK